MKRYFKIAVAVLLYLVIFWALAFACVVQQNGDPWIAAWHATQLLVASVAGAAAFIWVTWKLFNWIEKD